MANAEVDYKALQAAAKLINDSCGTTIKVIGGKKDDLIAAIKGAVAEELSGIPEAVVAFHNDCLIGDPDDPPAVEDDQTNDEEVVQEEDDQGDVEEGDVKESDRTRLGNTFDVLKQHADVLGVETNDKLSLNGLEILIFEQLDSLSEDEWGALPEETQKWDYEMGELAKELNKKKDERKANAKPKGEKKKEKKEKKEKKPLDPRPGFKFSEGTNAHQIMTVFDELFAASNGEGLKIKDIQDACERANVKSNNVRGRVSGVMKYASLPEGGSQVYKKDNLWYKNTGDSS